MLCNTVFWEQELFFNEINFKDSNKTSRILRILITINIKKKFNIYEFIKSIN